LLNFLYFSFGCLRIASLLLSFFTVIYLKVDEGIQTTGQEVIAAPADLWDSKPASPEYWYKKKGW